MRKNFYLTVLFLCMVGLCISSCGSGGGSTADPMGTATIRFVDELGTIVPSTTCGVNGTITLRVFVSNQRSDGAVVPVVNEKVSFVIVNAGSGASLATSDVRTGSDGEATCLFTSGNNTYSDIVRATTEGGATASIYINKTGGSVTPYIKTITASHGSTTPLVAHQTSVITVNVVDGSDKVVQGVLVRFRLAVNNSGATFADAYSDANIYAYTDAGGNATAIYQAGDADPYATVYDSIVAELYGYDSTKAVEIERSAAQEPSTEPLSVTLKPEPASVAAGATSIITATVSGTAKAGAQVTFSIPVNNSGARFINDAGIAVTTLTTTAGGSGATSVIYRAGSAGTGMVQDTVLALLETGANAATILTRTATVPSAYTVALAASDTDVKAGEVSVITATVTTNADGAQTPAAGVAVTFSLPVNSSGATLTGASATTDGSGKAVVIYRPGNTQNTVQDTVRAAVGASSNAVAITVNGSSTTGYSIDLKADPATLTASDSNSVITATVKNNAGAVISGVTVSFAVTGGIGGSVTPTSAVTDGSGNAVTTYTGIGGSPAVGSTAVVTARIMSNTYSDAVIITYPAPPEP